jgi:hypothetical protein
MEQNSIAQHIQRCNRNLLLLSLAFLVGAVVVLLGSWFVQRWFTSEASQRNVALASLVVAIPLMTTGIFLVVKLTLQSSLPGWHPIYRTLSKFGDPDAVARHVDEELRAVDSVLTVGRLTMTPHWLLQADLFDLRIAHVPELVWFYSVGSSTLSTENGSIILHNKRMESFEITGQLGAINEAIQTLHRHAPWAFCGFDEQLRTQWRKDPRSLIKAVRTKRESIEKTGSRFLGL